MFNEKTLVCKDCGQSFPFTVSEQEFLAEKGFTNEPQRCKSCRTARKQSGSRDGGGARDGAPRMMFDAVCGNCGRACQVPFEPRSDRPVYCSDCFRR
jgi:CxxC-x17-CxxC domain-containing protein